MSIYISKNNQQTGPFEESKVLEMLGNGQLSPDDFAIRQGAAEWQKLGQLFPAAGRRADNQPQFTPPLGQPPAAQAAPKKSRKGLLLGGCGGFILLAFLVAGGLGFLAYRNMNPAESKEDLPDKVKDFTLDTRYPPKGDIWGKETSYVGLYKDASTSQSVLYLMTVYADESAAKEAMRTELFKSCKSGETPLYFSFVKNAAEVSQGATCAIPLYVQKDNKLVALGGAGADGETFIKFAEHLPFNEGASMIKK
jgi:hypothetical protein